MSSRSSSSTPSSALEIIPFAIVVLCVGTLTGWMLTTNLAQPAGAVAPAPGPGPAPAGSDEVAEAQAHALEDQRDELISAKERLTYVERTDMAKMDATVAQSKEIQRQMEKLLLDLTELARTDADAREIMAKYSIKVAPKQ